MKTPGSSMACSSKAWRTSWVTTAPRFQGILANLNPSAKQSFVVSLRVALAAALRKRGHTVQKYVGRSQFRCDLAISDANGEQFSLGVLLDGDAAATASMRELYIFRLTMLRSFDWKVIDVLDHDCLLAPEDVLNCIEELPRGEDAPVLPGPEQPEPVEAQTVEVEAPPSSEALPL
nr:hypothetical protein [Pseudomonas protegens]